MIMFDHETLMAAGPGLLIMFLAFAAYAIGVNVQAHLQEKRRLEALKRKSDHEWPHMFDKRENGMSIATKDIMTEGEIWTVKGLLHYDEFEVSFSDWDSMNPEQKARTFYEEQTFLINTNLTRQRVIRSWPEVIESKDGPETRMGGETGGPELGDDAE